MRPAGGGRRRRPGRSRPTAVAAGLAVLVAAVAAGCDAGVPAPPAPEASAQVSGSPGTTADADRPVLGSSAPVTAEVTTVATGLPAPWALAPLPDGRLLVTLRDEARVVVVDPDDGDVVRVRGDGADQLARETRPGGEAGLLGAAVDASAGEGAVTVFLYRTGADANAVVRGSLTLGGEPELGGLTTVLDGIPKAGNHDGGRLKLGPDGYLYVTTGDAGDRPAAQDPASLGGKILRITPDGDPAPGNPDPGSPVWSLGHRNVQGIAWDADGRMLASEFGQDTWDELNEIRPGANYGWPEVEGAGPESAPGPVGGPAVADGFARPLATWRTRDASPSGLAIAGGPIVGSGSDRRSEPTISPRTDDQPGVGAAAYLASLRGERLWRVPLGPGAGGGVAVGVPQVVVDGEGRLRDVVAAPDGSLWVLTNNTDGRGRPRDGDDRLLHVVIAPD
ncbi:PQQ-dependent sugar dehydrogenase [Xylanimonas protaetiae]|uniref:PQQ-dependent sugar dehydrogenase n=1 Tax=Xylanimonas protaetiae TaxID=2509457 RepID=A0A4P6F748_9MICO|nr:PQQ-dependent sugar dehydrogenase [Xylanimonas protaetiae]QAY69057.1 PQQ-dependent sugar dehydrogenase [Xylanimonas protaetiae]